MKKKGFSYVEALIVILFIGLLFFFVLPKMFNTFDNSVPKKDDSFSVEVANIARVAKRQWIEDNENSSGPKYYSRCIDGTCKNSLNMYTKSDIEYYIHIDSDGYIDRIYVKDRTHQYTNDGDFDINNIFGVREISTLKEDEIVTISNELASLEDENIKLPEGTICKRARRLHTTICDYKDKDNYCSGEGYTESGRYLTNQITYGNHGTNGKLSSGDAFDCDVNGDHKFDSETERFYYVSDYFNTHTLSYESDTATLIYYTNVSSGKPDSTKLTPYDSNNLNTNGPLTAYLELPKEEDWPNVSLKETKRQIMGYDSSTSTFNTELSEFDYSGYAARLLTSQEAAKSSRISSNIISERYVLTANYLFENTNYSTDNTIHGYWLETVDQTSNNRSCILYPKYRNCNKINTSMAKEAGVRPVIDVSIDKIYY